MIQLSPINAQYIKNQKEGSTVKQTSLIKNTNTSTITKVPTAKERAMTVGIGLGIIGVIAGAVFLIKRCTIPSKYKELFKSLNKINDFKEFVQSAYKGIVKCENMQDIAPKEVNIVEKINGGSGIGGYQPLDNSISIDATMKEFGRFEIFNALRHELEHCKQCNWMLRCLGKDEYLKIWGKNNPFYNPQNNDKFTQHLKKSLSDKLENGFSHTLSQPKLEITDQRELNRLHSYIASQGITSEKYGMASTKTPIEKEAYKAGNKVRAWYSAFNLGLHSSLNKKSK